jgi:galactose mutarotase-like enzyme
LTIYLNQKNFIKLFCKYFNIQNFPYLGIWAKPNAPFVCIEPWVGMADFTDANGEILQKRGMVILAIGEEFEREFRMGFWKKE